jgi:hypothetical protein
VFELLALKLGSHHDAPLVPSLPSRVEATRKRAKPPLRSASLEAGALACPDARPGSESIGAGAARGAIQDAFFLQLTADCFI